MQAWRDRYAYNLEWRRRNRDRVREYNREYTKKNPEERRRAAIRYRTRNPFHIRAKRLWHAAAIRAAEKNLPFSLTEEHVRELLKPLTCSVSGIQLDIQTETKRAKPWSPSLDRIDPTKGYVPENVRIVAYIVNVAKNGFSDDDLNTMCLAIAGRLNRA